MVSKVSKVNWLDAEILEGLGVWIDDLIDELALDLVTGKNRPPKSLVKESGGWLKDGLWHVNVSAVLVNFLVNQLSDLGHRIVLWSVKLVCLGCGAVILEHLLEGRSDIDGVHRPEALLHVVRGENVGDTSKLVEKTILETKHWCWSDDGSLWEDAANDLLSTGLGSEELRWRIWIGIVRRDVDETVNIVLGDCISDPLGSLNMDILQIEVLGWIVAANQVVNNIGMADRLLKRLSVAEIILLRNRLDMLALPFSIAVAYHKDDLSEITRNLQVSLGHLLTVWDDDGASLSC